MKKLIRQFTLVEILMVAGMICLIAAMILVAYNGVYRSWASRNTIATMKAAHLALDRYMLEHGAYPGRNTRVTLQSLTDANSNDPYIAKLANDLLQECAPFSYRLNSGEVRVFDDFGNKPPQTSVQDIYYVFPANNSNSFALISAGKDGNFGTDDDIIYLPGGNSSLKPGFYMGSTTNNGGISNAEPLAQ